MAEKIFTIEEAAEYMRVSHDTIRKMIKDGELEAARVRGQWRIRKQALDDLFTRQQKQQEPNR